MIKMPFYQYKVRDKFGKPLAGFMTADSESLLAEKLTQMGYVPVSIRRIQKKVLGLGRNVFVFFRSVRSSDLNMFTRQFVTLQKAGLPILTSLATLKEQAQSKVFRDVISRISRDIEAGENLSSALAKHPHIFNSLYVAMIRAGEVGGRLDEVLSRLALLGEHEEKLRQRAQAATRYPVIVVVAIGIAFFVLTTLVVPRFAKIFDQFDTTLPLPTRILLGAHAALTKYWWLTLLGAGLFFYGFKAALQTKKGRKIWDGLKLKIPIFGSLMLEIAMSRFSRITGLLMHSGVPLLKILDLAASGTGNVVVAGAIDRIKDSIAEGKGMAEPMKVNSLFPAAVVQMVSVGEETGRLDELLLHVADYYDTEVDYTLNNLTVFIEPILIFVLGCCVLFMALAIFLPMWNMMNLFRK